MPYIDDIVDSLLGILISLSENDCVYEVSVCYWMVEWVNHMFLKAKATSVNEDNLNWCKDMSGTFYDEYWKAYCTEIEILDKMEA